MPIKTIIDRKYDITIHIASGDLAFAEIVNALKSFYERPDLPENVIWDGRNATLKNLDLKELEQIAVFPLRYRDRKEGIKAGKRALVAPKDLDFGLSRIIDNFKEDQGENLPFELEIFRSYDEALKWILEH